MEFDIEREVKRIAPVLTRRIAKAASESHNEAEFRSKLVRFIEDFAASLRLPIHVREEYTLVNGRADAVYNRLVVEYEPPNSLHASNTYRANQHAIGQIENYISGLSRRERHRPERLAGVVLDGSYFVFVRFKGAVWRVDEPVRVASASTERFLRLVASLSTELAVIPENLIADFGENTTVSRRAVRTLHEHLAGTDSPKVRAIFDQWRLQFSEVCDYEKASKLKLEAFSRKFGVVSAAINPFEFFFCLHTYYALFIKLLAVQIAHYYLMPKLGTDLSQAATFESQELRRYLSNMEAGGVFRELGIGNFLERDFFGWYLDLWDENVYRAIREIVATLANYSLVTLDVDPDSTRDLLKKLYQQLMPKELRHNLGEYYTPDWLAERLLNMLEAGRYQGDPDRRILDPACGSGTFLVIAIKRIRERAQQEMSSEPRVLEKILSNVVGFDLNPLAVISARTNYLLALGELLQHRTGEINIPVYLCDSIMTPQEGEDLFGKGVLRFDTAVGSFAVPKTLVQAQYINTLSDLLEEAVRLDLNRDQFAERLARELPLHPTGNQREIRVVCDLYDKLVSLERQGINGIWARIIKNGFAPLFAETFDYVVGNPPWVNWEHLPENYRKQLVPLWSVRYGLFPHRGFQAILGSSKDDISILMTYVSMEKYLKTGGKLGFLITQSVFKASGGGQGFRRFVLPDGEPIRAIHVDDMVELNPFEGASNRTSAVILQKGRPTTYPMRSYLYWRKAVKGKRIPLEATLDEVLQMTERRQFVAEPVDQNDTTSPWITGRPKGLRALKRALGRSEYVARAGVYSGGANAVYWVDTGSRRPDGLRVVSNITQGAKRKVDSVQTAIEPDLLYPLLRGSDVRRWKADPKAHLLLTHLPGAGLKAIPEDEMKTRYPKTYQYLKRFEEALRERKSRGVVDMIKAGAPFYTMFAVGEYTFAPYKVVWTRIAKIEAAAVSNFEGKPVVPQETISLVPCAAEEESHYIAGMINSSIFQYAAASYSQAGGKSMGSMHVLRNIRIPRFDSKSGLHRHLAELSEKTHEAATNSSREAVWKLEEEMDEVAARVWQVTIDGLKEIRMALGELA